MLSVRPSEEMMMGWNGDIRVIQRAAGVLALAAFLMATPALRAEPARLSVLMLGDDGHHRPADLAKLITPILAKDGIDITYTQDVEALTPERLAKCDALLILPRPRRFAAQAGGGIDGFRRAGQRVCSLSTAPPTASATATSTPPSSAAVSSARHRRVPRRDHRRPASGHARFA